MLVWGLTRHLETRGGKACMKHTLASTSKAAIELVRLLRAIKNFFRRKNPLMDTILYILQVRKHFSLSGSQVSWGVLFCFVLIALKKVVGQVLAGLEGGEGRTGQGHVEPERSRPGKCSAPLEKLSLRAGAIPTSGRLGMEKNASGDDSSEHSLVNENLTLLSHDHKTPHPVDEQARDFSHRNSGTESENNCENAMYKRKPEQLARRKKARLRTGRKSFHLSGK